MRFTNLFSWVRPQQIRASRSSGTDSRRMRLMTTGHRVVGCRSTDLAMATVLPVGVDMSRREYIRLIEEAFGDMGEMSDG